MISRSIVITGSSRGIGFGLAKYFLQLGHKIIINGRSENHVKKALQELKKISSSVQGIAGDVTKEITHKALISLCVDHFGSVDIYINNAGIPQDNKSFIKLKNTSIEDLIYTNIFGLMIGTKTAVNFMTTQGFGKIFNMEGFGSDGRILNKLTLYGTSKRAVNYFTKSISNELKSSSIQIGTLNPGMVKTDFLEISMSDSSEAEKKQFEKVKRIMAENVETVVPVLADKILKSTKNYDRIKFLGPGKLFIKILKLILS
jgi:short-subunit dehydrogenase